MTSCIFVAGTFGYRGSIPVGAWWSPTSPFAKMIAGLGLRVVGSASGERVFIWSTDLNGVLDTQHVDWRAGGENLYQYIVPSLCPAARIPPKETTCVVHSHGLQVALYAAAAGLQIGHLVSVCSPIRFDMQAVTKQARPNIGTWTHLFSWSDDDPWQPSGEDGLTWTRDAPLADANIGIPHAGHSGLLEDAANFPRWQSNLHWLF